MTKLLETLSRWFKPTMQSGLEAYIASRHPTNAADVDRLQREYTHKQWGRGI
jgi:hypothetical protein